MRRLCHPPLPPFPRRSTYSRAPSLHGRYPASSLLWAPPTPSRLRPPPWVYVARPTLLRRFRGGARRVSPVDSHVLVTVLPLRPRRRVPSKPEEDGTCCLRPQLAGSASGIRFCRGHVVRSLSLRPGDSLTTPKAALSMGFSSLGFPPGCHPSYGASGSCPGGSVSH